MGSFKLRNIAPQWTLVSVQGRSWVVGIIRIKAKQTWTRTLQVVMRLIPSLDNKGCNLLQHFYRLYIWEQFLHNDITFTGIMAHIDLILSLSDLGATGNTKFTKNLTCLGPKLQR